jgi:hypothetical protein
MAFSVVKNFVPFGCFSRFGTNGRLKGSDQVNRQGVSELQIADQPTCTV